MKGTISKLLVNLLFFLIYPLGIAGQEAGLFFHSHEVIKDKRTSLELNPDRPFSFPKGFVLEFDLLMRNEVSGFGYVFRIIANDSVNIDFLSGHKSGQNCFWLVGGAEQRVLFELKDIPNFRKEQWIPVVFKFLPEANTFTLSINGKKESISLQAFEDIFTKFRFCFGANNHKKFFSMDVPPMNLRNVSLKIAPGDKAKYYWPLSVYNKNTTKDVVKGVKAVATNPVWLIDEHLKWKNVSTIPFPAKPLIAYNEKKSLLYLVQKEYIYVYNINEGVITDTIWVESGFPYDTKANQIIYNNYTKQLWSYDFNVNEIVTFDFETRKWSIIPGKSKEPRYWHHNHAISSTDSSLITFGGYGHFRYNSLIQKYDRKEEKWITEDLSSHITPRYLSAAGKIKNNWLIFGGYGSKTGEQQLAPHATFDLYTVNPDNYEVEKLWEIPADDSRVQSNSLVVDSENNCFYTLSYSSRFYNSFITLYAWQIDQPKYTVYADSIPYLFNDTESYCDLYFNKKSSKFVALTLSHPEINKDYEINLYSLSYPPVRIEDMGKEKSFFSSLFFYMLLTLLLLILISGIGYVFKRRRKKQQPTDVTELPQPDEMALHTFQQSDIQKPDFYPSSMVLIGGFQAINNKGKDVTGFFSPTLKNLFLSILLNTLKNNKGVSSLFLQETFWFDKTEKSARNNRNVNLKKLRDLLEEFDGIDLDSSTGYWSLVIDKNFYCDYIDLQNQLKTIREKKDKVSSKDITHFVNLVSSGAFLPGVQAEWVDSFKSDYSHTVIDCIGIILNKAWSDKDYKLLMQCSNILLLQDPTDENAISIKCYALNKIGKKGLAKVAYELFCRDYFNLLNVRYEITFEEILSKEQEEIRSL